MKALPLLIYATAAIGGMALAEGNSPRASRWIDSKGHAQLAVELGRVLAGKSSFPVMLKYNSGESRGTILPSQWGLPMVESRIVQISEQRAEAYLPDGSWVPLDLAADTEVTSSVPGVNVTRKGKHISITQDGNHYEFYQGRLTEHILPDGTKFSWTFENDFKDRQLSINGREVLRVKRESHGPEGNLSLQFPDLGKPCVLHFNALPSEVETSLRQMGYEVESSISRMDMTDGTTVKLSSQAEEGKQLLTITGWPRESGDLNLVLGRSNLLERVNEVSYLVESRSSGPQTLSSIPMITVTDPLHGTQLVQKGQTYDNAAVMHEFDLLNTRDTYYIHTPSGDRVRKIVLNGKEVYKAFFDRDGQKISTIENGVKIDWNALAKSDAFKTD